MRSFLSSLNLSALKRMHASPPDATRCDFNQSIDPAGAISASLAAIQSGTSAHVLRAAFNLGVVNIK